MTIPTPPTGSRPRRQRRDHLRLPEHPRLRRWFPEREAPRRSMTPSSLVRRPRRHPSRRRRSRARPRGGVSAARVRPAISSASVPFGRRSARSPTRSSSTGRRARRGSRPSTGRSTPARSSSSFRQPDGARRRPSPCRRPDRRCAGPPVRGAGHRADHRSAGAHPDLRQRHVPLDLLRHVTHRPRRWCDMATCGNRAKAARIAPAPRSRCGESEASQPGALQQRSDLGREAGHRFLVVGRREARDEVAVADARGTGASCSATSSGVPTGWSVHSVGVAVALEHRPSGRVDGLGTRVADDDRADPGRPLDLGRVAPDGLAVLDAGSRPCAGRVARPPPTLFASP